MALASLLPFKVNKQLFSHKEGGRDNQRECQRGISFQSRVENTNITDCISSLHIITIYAPMIYSANGTRLTARCHFTGLKKLSNSRAQPPPTCPRNGAARIHNHYAKRRINPRCKGDFNGLRRELSGPIDTGYGGEQSALSASIPLTRSPLILPLRIRPLCFSAYLFPTTAVKKPKVIYIKLYFQ